MGGIIQQLVDSSVCSTDKWFDGEVHLTSSETVSNGFSSNNRVLESGLVSSLLQLQNLTTILRLEFCEHFDKWLVYRCLTSRPVILKVLIS